MAHITDEQVLEIIKRNARDFWTIADENAKRFETFNAGNVNRIDVGKIDLTNDNFISLCITQFIQLKSNKNFGTVKIQSKDDEKPNPKSEEEDKERKVAEIEEENQPVLDSQLRTLATKIAEHPQGQNIKAQYLKKLGKKSERDLTKKECFDLIIVGLHQKKDSIHSDDSGGDKQ